MGFAAIVFIVFASVYLLGAILFGISIIIAGVFSWIAALLYMIGSVPASLMSLFPALVGVIGHVVAAVGVFWVGILLWSYSAKKSKQ